MNTNSELLTRASAVWDKKHPHGKMLAVGASNNGQRTKLNEEFNDMLMLKVGTLTKMVLHRKAPQ